MILFFWAKKFRPREVISIHWNCPARKETWNPDLFTLRVRDTALQLQLRGHHSLWSLCKWCFWSTMPFTYTTIWVVAPGVMPAGHPVSAPCQVAPSRRKLSRQESQAPRDWILSLPTPPSNRVFSKVTDFIHSPATLHSLHQHTSQDTPLHQALGSALGTPSCPWGSLALSHHRSPMGL